MRVRLTLACLLSTFGPPTASAAIDLPDGFYRLLGVITCEPCQDGMQPIAVIEAATGNTSHLRIGDALGGSHRISRISVGQVELVDIEGGRHVLEISGERSIYEDELQIIIARDADLEAQEYLASPDLTP